MIHVISNTSPTMNASGEERKHYCNKKQAMVSSYKYIPAFIMSPPPRSRPLSLLLPVLSFYSYSSSRFISYCFSQRLAKQRNNALEVKLTDESDELRD